jgi:hypothetical protein
MVGVNRMEMCLYQIGAKPNDYIICKECKHINWYENEKCIDCGQTLHKCKDYSVEEWVEDEYEYWIDDGWTERDADDVLYGV